MPPDLSFDTPPLPDETVVCLPQCCVAVRCDQTQVLALRYLRCPAPIPAPPRSGLAAEVAKQLQAYGRDPSFRFDLPLAAAGTVFQRRVWEALRAIAPGQVRTYGEMAAELRSAARAVGQACGANPYAPIIPCHRVIGRRGLGGFAHCEDVASDLLAIKLRLLQHEGWAGAA